MGLRKLKPYQPQTFVLRHGVLSSGTGQAGYRLRSESELLTSRIYNQDLALQLLLTRCTVYISIGLRNEQVAIAAEVVCG